MDDREVNVEWRVKEIRLTSKAVVRTPAPRGARLPRFIGARPDAESSLSALRVVVVGSGSVGANIALHLSRLQVDRLLLVDHGRLKPESLLTHPIHPEYVSRPKASSLGRLCKRISPPTKVDVFDGPVESLGLNAFDGYDRVVLATDNLPAEVEVSQRCLWFGLPLTQASVHGDSLVCQIRSLSNQDAGGPCLVCAYSPAEWKALNREARFSCQGAAGTAATRRAEGAPTMSASFLCSMAADLALTRILRQELLLGSRDSDSMLEFCGYTYRSVISPLSRDPDCPCDHSLFRRVKGSSPIPDSPLSQLARMAGYGKRGDFDRISFRVDRLAFCEQGACHCNGGYPARRFFPVEGGTLRCHRCGGIVRPQLFFTHDPVPASVLADDLDRPLRELGAGSASYVIVRGPGDSVLIDTD